MPLAIRTWSRMMPCGFAQALYGAAALEVEETRAEFNTDAHQGLEGVREQQQLGCKGRAMDVVLISVFGLFHRVWIRC